MLSSLSHTPEMPLRTPWNADLKAFGSVDVTQVTTPFMTFLNGFTKWVVRKLMEVSHQPGMVLVKKFARSVPNVWDSQFQTPLNAPSNGVTSLLLRNPIAVSHQPGIVEMKNVFIGSRTLETTQFQAVLKAFFQLFRLVTQFRTASMTFATQVTTTASTCERTAVTFSPTDGASACSAAASSPARIFPTAARAASIGGRTGASALNTSLTREISGGRITFSAAAITDRASFARLDSSVTIPGSTGARSLARAVTRSSSGFAAMIRATQI